VGAPVAGTGAAGAAADAGEVPAARKRARRSVVMERELSASSETRRRKKNTENTEDTESEERRKGSEPDPTAFASLPTSVSSVVKFRTRLRPWLA
jgi:hypothetical protein